MSKELNALECLMALEQDIKDRTILAEDRQLKLCAIIKQALLELKSIKETNPSEALEAFGRITLHTEYDNDSHYDGLHFEDDCKLVNKALEFLEAIENANPSEALECLECLYCNPEDYRGNDRVKDYETIKDYILKKQKPKQYLKWEDLEFNHTPKMIDVKVGDNKYTLVVGFNVAGNTLAILRNDKKQYYFLEADKQFFNDLHLEVLE